MITADLGAPIRQLADIFPWLTTPVIGITAVCIFAQPIGICTLWFRPKGLRAVLAAIVAAGAAVSEIA